MHKSAFAETTPWKRGMYSIEERYGQKCIVLIEGSKVEKYYPLNFVNIPNKQPRSQDIYLDLAVHKAFARVNEKDDNSIIAFVNRWGLLGIQREYISNFPQVTDDDRMDSDEEAFLNTEIGYVSGYGNYESVNSFIEALCEYKTLLKRIQDVQRLREKAGDPISEEEVFKQIKKAWAWTFPNKKPPIADTALLTYKNFKQTLKAEEIMKLAANRYWPVEGLKYLKYEKEVFWKKRMQISSDFLEGLEEVRQGIAWDGKEWFPRWQFNTLLGAIYQLTYLELLKGYYFYRCKYCRGLFSTSKYGGIFCSTNCNQNLHKKDERLEKVIIKAKEMFPKEDKNWLAEQVKCWMGKPSMGEKRALKKIKETLIKQKGEN